jgi:hypothetical protein
MEGTSVFSTKGSRYSFYAPRYRKVPTLISAGRPNGSMIRWGAASAWGYHGVGIALTRRDVMSIGSVIA